MAPLLSLRTCLLDRGIDPSGGIRIVMRRASVTSVRALCSVPPSRFTQKGEHYMESLFRLALNRPAVAQDPANPNIRISQDSPFQKNLAEASNTEQPRGALQQVARNFVTGNDFIGSPGANPLSDQLAALSASLDRLERQAAVSHADVVAAVNQAFDAHPTDLGTNQTLAGPRAKLRDSLLAIKQWQDEDGCQNEAIT